MKFLTILASIVAVTVAQRPTYAGLSPKGYPELASRFRDPDADQDVIANSGFVENRLGADDDQTPVNLPTDARGDVALVNRLNQWPEENRPFWLINAEHIDRQRRPNGNMNQAQQNIGTVQLSSQQSLNQIQPSLNQNQQPVQLDLSRNGQVQARLGEPIATETRTISQRGSYAGGRTV